MERKHKDFKDALFVAVDKLYPMELTASREAKRQRPQRKLMKSRLAACKSLPAGSHALVEVLSYGELNARGQKSITQVTLTR